jgi:hypothetical protein
VVGGLERFRDHFARHNHQYALIGGAACDPAMDQVGLPFRATRDLDVVLIVEALDTRFARSFWQFIRLGQYQLQQSTAGRPRFYRFADPEARGFPSMLEIFSAKPEGISLADDSHLTPIPFDEAASSLSAILLQTEYYAFLKAGIRSVDGVPIVGPEHLVPLKARAWLDLTERKAVGEEIDRRDITKHRNDVFRLSRIVDPAPRGDVPQVVREDMRRFLERVGNETIDLKGLGMGRDSVDMVIRRLGRIYGTGEGAPCQDR